MTRRILFLTGTRADWGKLKPLVTAVRQAGYEYGIFATGMHTMKQYGLTHFEIAKAGFDYFQYINQDAETPMCRVVSNTIEGLSLYLAEYPADLLVVHGDRPEALAGAITGAFNNILTAHIEGGEISGTLDESIRHAVTKLAHVHFVSNEEAAGRLRQLGEEHVFVIGSPDIDVMLSPDLPCIAEVRQKYGIPYDHYAICIYHPVTTEEVNLALFDLMEEDKSHQYVVIYPNNDRGAQRIIKRIDNLQGNFCILPSMRFEHFLTLLKHADFIIGNSSAGIREAPVYGVPTIDIGTRQNGRSCCKSIVNCQTIAEMRWAIKNPPKAAPSFHFGRGDSAKRFVEALPQIWDISPQKRFIDLK